jgi:hypothetical protein
LASSGEAILNPLQYGLLRPDNAAGRDANALREQAIGHQGIEQRLLDARNSQDIGQSDKSISFDSIAIDGLSDRVNKLWQ